MRMKASLKKAFRFSCSYTKGAKTVGCNYVLWVTLDYLDQASEAAISNKIEAVLIQPIHNRDISEHVDFLKNVPISDLHLLEAFYRILSAELPECGLSSLELERDGSTRILYARE